MRKPVFGDSDKSDTNWTIQLQKMARSLKFQFSTDCSENKGADHLCGYLCFRICKKEFLENYQSLA